MVFLQSNFFAGLEVRKEVLEMGNAIVIIALVIIVILAVKGSTKHLLGQGGCCGGSAPEKMKKKKLHGAIVCEKTVYIEGMHCDQCKKRVESSLNAKNGMVGKVDLKKNLAIVKANRSLEDGELVEAVEHAGFTVRKIENRQFF